jgi:TetR/AcrR family transcriptional regulator, fatty acid metabolism regulator protein
MPKLDRETRRKQIIEISLEIIRQSGIQRLTIKEISNQVGISEQAIYRHFENKLDILVSIIQYFNLRLKESFEPKKNDDSVIGQIKHMTQSHMKLFDLHPSMAVVIFGEEIFQNESTLSREVADALNKRLDHMTKLIKKGQNNGEINSTYPPAHLAHMFLGSLRLLATRWRLSGFNYSLAKKGQLLINDLIDLIKL